MISEANLEQKEKDKISSLSKNQIINNNKKIIKAQNKILKEEKDKLEEQFEKKETVKNAVKRLNKTKIGQRLSDLKKKLARIEKKKKEQKSRNNSFLISSLSTTSSSINSQASINCKSTKKGNDMAI